MKQIATDPDDIHAYNVADFSFLASIVEDVTTNLCNSVKGPGTSDFQYSLSFFHLYAWAINSFILHGTLCGPGLFFQLLARGICSDHLDYPVGVLPFLLTMTVKPNTAWHDWKCLLFPIVRNYVAKCGKVFEDTHPITKIPATLFKYQCMAAQKQRLAWKNSNIGWWLSGETLVLKVG